MSFGNAIVRAGGRVKNRLAGLSFADKVAAGFGGVIALLFCSMIIAGLGAHAARESADSVKNRRLPLMETALALEGEVYEAIFHSSMFGSSGDMASYSAARIRFAAMRETANILADRAGAVPGGAAVVRDMEVLRDLARQLDLVVEKKRTLNEALAVQRGKLRRTADAMGEALLELQARTAAATTRGKETTLDEKARLLMLNVFALAVEDVTGRALAAGTARGAADLSKADAYFAERWEESRGAVASASALPSSAPGVRPAQTGGADMEQSVAAYRETMLAMLSHLEEAARLNAERGDITNQLAALTRGIVGLVRADMAKAVTRADTALRGATATLFAGVILACALAAGAAIAFARSRPAREETEPGGTPAE